MELAGMAAGLLKPVFDAQLGYAAAGAGIGGLKAAYNYFAKTATKDYGDDWHDQMNLNQINNLAKKSIMKTRRSCKHKRAKKKFYKKRGQYKRKSSKKKKKTKTKTKTKTKRKRS